MRYQSDYLKWIGPLLDEKEMLVLLHHTRRNRDGFYIAKKTHSAYVRYGLRKRRVIKIVERIEALTKLYEILYLTGLIK